MAGAAEVQGGVAETVAEGQVASGGVEVVEVDTRRRLTITMRSSGGRSVHELFSDADGGEATVSDGEVVRLRGNGSVETSEKPRPTHPNKGAAISSHRETCLSAKISEVRQ